MQSRLRRSETRCDKSQRGVDLLRIECRPTDSLAACPGRNESVASAFANQPSLKMGNRTEDMKDELAGSGVSAP